jgi:hypothetical protein
MLKKLITLLMLLTSSGIFGSSDDTGKKIKIKVNIDSVDDTNNEKELEEEQRALIAKLCEASRTRNCVLKCDFHVVQSVELPFHWRCLR